MAKVSGVPVARALRQVVRQAKTTVRQINQKAAKLVTKGDYAGAETLVGLARSVNDFRREVESMKERWRSLIAGSRPGRPEETPLWEYYRPILRVLDGMGGRASRRDLEREFERACVPSMKPGDTAATRSGLPKWKRALARARSAMIKEGFVEPAAKGTWQITDAGKRATVG